VSVYRVTYGGCLPGKDVRLFVVEGGGHEWPGATWAQHFVDISASEATIEFAVRHSRTPPAGSQP
jgi:poly(3-hydroxybutyrate) depolymerase